MLFSAVALVQSDMIVNVAPKEARPLIQPKPERFKGQHILGWVLLILSFFMLIADFVIAVWHGVSSSFGFWQFFARFLIILYVYKAFDMVCFDWLLVTKSHFFQHYYPELEGCETYSKYGFNLKAQILRIIVYPFLCAFLAWLCVRMF